MNDSQWGMYLSIWGQLRKKLRAQQMTPKDADAMRHRLIREALGYDKSSKDLTNPELDKVKAAMLALLEPSLLGPQMEDHDRRRHLGRLDQLLEELGKPRAYAEAIARRMASEQKIRSADLETMDLAELRKIIGSLKYQTGGVKRPSKARGAKQARAMAALEQGSPDDPDWSVN